MSRRRRNTLLSLSLVGAGALVFVLIWYKPWFGSEPNAERDFPLPPYSQTRFLNTGPDAHYIGVAACVQCHGRQHQSFLLTPHSRALGDVDLDDEPSDGAFFHSASGRSYRVYRQDKTLRHEEVLRTAEGKEIARVDVPIRYRIGSGNFTRSYLVEIDGFLHESPITWYTAKQKWGMSPGYDRPNHPTFERAADLGCLVCHAGRVEPVDGSVHRVTLREKVIGCENCHGPGSLHQDLHRSGKFTLGDEDLTIVNPGKLSRPLLEALCAHCHQSGAASVLLRGRRHTDFRPGRPLADFRTDYEFDVGNEQMTVVGHMEQLRRSPCYQKSPDLSCLTCHDPHARERPKDTTAFYRQKCLDCHATQPCGLEEAQRRKKDVTDNCAGCHMPRGDTDIPHIAFTHHRIGRHPPPRRADPGRIPELIPAADLSQVPELDRQRNLGMAYVMVSQSAEAAPFAEVFRERAKDLLTAVHAAGLRHDEIAAALAELYRDTDRDRAMEYRWELLHRKSGAPSFRTRVQFQLAAGAIEDQDFATAVGLLEELTILRRSADDWRLLGIAHLELDQPRQALAALQQAVAIRPTRPATHFGLADAYRRLGQAPLAQEHRDKGQWLHQHQQD